MPITSYTAGQILTAASLNGNFGTTVALVKSQTIGTTVASVTVTDAFNSTYDNYFITISGGVGSASAGVNLTFGATATGYYWAANYAQYNTATGGFFNGNNDTKFGECCYMSTAAISLGVFVQNANLAKETLVRWQNAGAATTTINLVTNGGGYINNTTQYTAFTLTPVSGTMTGGTIRVYGFANS